MSEGGYYLPRSMSYTLSRLQNYSRQKVKIANSIGSTQTFRANETIQIQLPDNALVDLSTLCLKFRAETTNGAGATGSTLSQHVECMIDSIYVAVNGVGVQTGFTQYGQLWKIYADFMGVHDKANMRRILQNYLIQEPGAALNGTQQFAIFGTWLGFLGQTHPMILDTSILGTVTVSIRLAGNNALVCSGNPTAQSTFSLSSVEAHLDVISLEDGIYYQLISQKLASGTPIQIPFTNVITVQAGSGATSRAVNFSVATNCLEAICGTIIPNDVNAASIQKADAATIASGLFTRGSATLTSSQFSLNNMMYPSWPLFTDDILIDTLTSLGVHNDTLGQPDPGLTSLALFTSKFFAHYHSFNHPADKDEVLLSGINTNGVALQGTWNVTATSGNSTAIVWLICKSILEVRAGRVVNLIL